MTLNMNITTTITPLEAALSYAKRGWPIFPCKVNAKRPLTPKGVHNATIDESRIRQWWAMWPQANIGLACGTASGLVVIDVDGEDGRQSLQKLVDTHGPLPRTLASSTGRGVHYIFRAGDDPIRTTTSELGKGIDTRSTSNYIIAPPSIHESGKQYAWQPGYSPDDIEPADLPAWLRPADKRKQAPAPAPAPAMKLPRPTGIKDLQDRAAAYVAAT